MIAKILNDYVRAAELIFHDLAMLRVLVNGGKSASGQLTES